MIKSIRLPVQGILQTDPHTCGACAMGALSRYHKLGFSLTEMRGMLGTDHSLLIFPGRDRVEHLLENQLEGWRGTLPSDVFFTIWNLRFTSRVLPMSMGLFRHEVQQQLEDDCPVVALVSSQWGPHWVLISGITPKGFWITDSLCGPKPVFWHQRKLSREIFAATAVVPGEDWLVSAMTRCGRFHSHLFYRLGRQEVWKCMGRGVTQLPG